MNLTVADVRTRTARAIGLSTSESSDTDAIDDWFNEAVVQFLRETKMFVTEQTISVTAATDEYDLPTSLLSFTEIWYEPANEQAYRLERVSQAEIIRMRLLENAFDDSPHFFALIGVNRIAFYPAPNQTGAIVHVYGVPDPGVMSATSDTPSATANGGIPSEFHPTLLEYVLWQAGMQEEHRPSDQGEKHMALWEQGLARARKSMNTKSGVMGAPVIWGRRRILPASPGVDIG